MRGENRGRGGQPGNRDRGGIPFGWNGDRQIPRGARRLERERIGHCVGISTTSRPEV